MENDARRNERYGPLCVLLTLCALLATGCCASAVGVNEAPPPGDSANYTPLILTPEVLAFVGDEAELLSINAFHVRSDGTMDFGAKYDPYVVYTFLRPVAADPDLPVGAGGGEGLENVTVRVGSSGNIQIDKRGGSGPNVHVNVHHRGMVEMSATSADEKDREDVLALPACTSVQLWEGAIDQGAPAEAVGRITYTQRGYDLRIEDIDFRLDFDETCAPGRLRWDGAPT